MRFSHWSKLSALRPLVVLLLAVLVGLAAAAPITAQWPPEVKNLKFFSEDKDVGELLNTMKGFAFGLGVRCQYCHVGEEGQPVFSFDFASDEKETKRKARVMLAMVAEINKNQLTKLGKEAAELIQVECVTCHRGAARPEQLKDVLVRVAGSEGVDASLAKYGELREEFHGSHTYDFSEGTLVQVAEGLAAADNLDGAVAFLEHNLGLFPESMWTMGTLSEAELKRGNKEAAIGVLEKILALSPENARVKQRIEQLKAEGQPEDSP